MRFPPAFLDEIRARLPVSQVAAKRVKLKRQGREYTGLSPFKHEKTPSFTVNDQKGFYHCFASGEHGDIFAFVMKTEGLTFPEAVERLAAEAGLPMPKPSPHAEAREGERERLRRLVAASCAFFESCLQGPAGGPARDYLDRRGLAPADIARFRLGCAPAGRAALKDHLAAQGFSQDDMARAGMLIAGDDIAVSYDRFRHRIMFPITDWRGAVIAFGGRALRADQQPKYLNSPETPLFHKGAVLFNAAGARQAAHDRGQVIVAEGYMDVIALARAGFANAVAPLGTALTADQLRLLWRMADEPVLCFDGDAAGQKAAHRAVETALPQLVPGKSLTFAFLPEGCDPDDLLRDHGPQALAEVLGDTRPLIDVLWVREVAGGDWKTPERRALLEKRLETLAETIIDRAIRSYYARELRRRLYELFGGWRPRDGRNRRFANARNAGTGRSGALLGDRRAQPLPAAAPGPASTSLVNSALVRGGAAIIPRREALMVISLVNHPWLVDEFAEEIAGIRFEAVRLHRLRDAVLDACAGQNPLDNTGLRTHLDKMGLSGLLAQVERAITHNSDRNSQPYASKRDVLTGWRHMLALHRKSSELKRELEAAEKAFTLDQSEQNYLKLRDLLGQLGRSEGEEAAIDGYGEGER